jgi:cytochrome c-type biogenesis protein CcmF
VFIGAAVLCLASFQVLATTSIPVYNSFLGFIGIDSNAALPADQIAHYTKFQLWAGIAVALLSAVGQLLWWRKANKSSFIDAITMPAMLTLLFSSLVIILSNKFDLLPFKLSNPVYITLFVAALFSVFSNLSIILGLLHKKISLSGGAVSHIGIALMLIGILFSSGYSKIVSLNNSGLLYSREFPDDMNRDNVLLWRNQPLTMGKYQVNYRGQFFEVKGVPGYVNKEFLYRTADEFKALARTDIKVGDKVYYKIGDTLEIYPENTFFEVEYKTKDKSFLLYPRAQVNPNMGLLASPDIKHFADRDLYTHVSSVPPAEEEREWSELKEYDVAAGDTIILNDYITVFNGVERIDKVPGVDMKAGDVAVQADMKIMGERKQYHAHPVLMIKDQMMGRVPEEIADLGLRITFLNIDTENNRFKIGVNSTQKDYIILKALEKPFVNILWIGTILMGVGFVMAIVRRNKEGNGATPAQPAGSQPRRARKAQTA